jgi:predicted MFS family arabinose efflux permease
VPVAQIGIVLGVAQLLPVLAAILTVRLLERFGGILTIALAGVGETAACLFLAGSGLVATAAMGYTGFMAMVAVAVPARNLFGQVVVAPRWRTTTAAIQTIGTAVGWAAAAAAGGLLIARVGFNGLFALSALLAASAAVLAWAYHRARTSQKTAAQPAELGV